MKSHKNNIKFNPIIKNWELSDSVDFSSDYFVVPGIYTDACMAK